MNKWKSESVARPQAHTKQNESSFIILIGLGQNNYSYSHVSSPQIFPEGQL